MQAKLDCSKLVPSSESLRTIAGIDEHFSSGRCQISSMTVQRGRLYAGTSWGCLVVADAATMRPVSVFRPYSEEIQAIVPLTGISGGGNASAKAKKSKKKGEDEEDLLLVTLGKGYRSLIGRFVSAALGGGAKGRSGDEDEDEGAGEAARIMTALLWRPDDWVAD